MVANFDQSTRKLLNSSKSNPCPVCGRTKDGDCRISHDGKMVLCHQNFDHIKSNQPDLWHFNGPSSDNRCGIYMFKDKTASETHKSYRGQVSGRRPTKRISKPKPASIPAKLKLLRLPAPQSGPESCIPTYIPKGVPANAVEITYSYSDTQKVVRFEWQDATNPKGHDKTYRQFHLNPNGEKVWNKGRTPWPAYRIDEVLGILENTPVNEPVVPLMLEGELNVELGRTHSIGGITLQGSDWSDEQIKAVIKELQQVNCQALPYLYDNDDRGIEKANKIKAVCSRLQFPCILIDPVTIFPGIPEKGDIKEILDNMDAEEFIRRLEEEIHRQAAESARATELDDEYNRIHEENLKYGDDGPDLKKEFNQQALEFLFGDKPWMCADNKLYFWTGTYYKYSPDSELRPRIASYCNSFSVFKEKKGLTYPFANPASAKQVLEWVKMRLEINSDLLNPPGLNCTNGVLQLHWETTPARLAPTPRWELVNHNPEFRYTYEPIATYNSEASTEHCDRLMGVLSAPQQDIFLKTIAASLDLETVRKYKGRMVRALLLKGYGSNGKDTLREIVSLMYGRIGMTSATLSDFASYDEGRKFPLARTADSRVNWASENAQTARLDKIQSLKAFITGDTLSREGKGKDEEDFTPKAIAVFNCNDTPNMQGSLEAIKSRYGVLSFDKTFKVKADPTRGEIEADPRFKYDPDFLKTEVLPAFLNKVLNALVALMSDGIDYAATEAAMAAIQAENSHLFQFSQDTGLNYSPDDVLTASDIWTKLEAWYQDNGTLVYETTTNDKVKALWFDQPRRGDHNVKGANQVLARIQQLFPKATRATIYSATAKKSVPALKGIGFVATRPSSDPVPTQHPPQETVTQQDFRPTRPSFSNFEQNQEILEEAETETDIENLADNFVAEFILETVEPAKTGSGGSEPLDINVSICGTGAETGSGDSETGSGGIENPIAPEEPETTPTPQSVPPLANQATEPDIEIGDRVVIARSDNHKYRDETGEVVDSCLGTRGEKKFLVRFDKKISNIFRDILQDYFPATDVIPIARDFANRIFAAIGYNSPAVASAIQNNLDEAIDAGKLTSAEVVAVCGKAQFAEFQRLVARRLGDPGVAP
jgi:putative DNA primase/helicase